MKKKKVLTKKKRKVYVSALKPIHIKLNDADRKAIVSRAKRWAKGQVSAFMRHAALAYTPKKGEAIAPYPGKGHNRNVKVSKK